MWIRNTLIAIPIFLIIFLVSSWAWVPSASDISADPSRQDRLIISLPGDPQSLNPWFSNTATDSDVHGYIFEGLASADGNFLVEPCLAETLKVGEDVVVTFSANDDVDLICKALESQLKQDFPSTFKGIKEYVHRDFEGGLKFVNRRTAGGAASSGSATIPEWASEVVKDAANRGPDMLVRRVIQFRAGEPETPKQIPSAVVTDVTKRIDEVLEKRGVSKAWVSKFDRWTEARNAYAMLTGVEVEWVAPEAVEAPEVDKSIKPEAMTEEQKAAAKKAADDAKALEEKKTKHGEALTEAARAKHGPKASSFAEYLNGFTKGRITEHPVIEVKLRENVKWHDYDQSKETLDIEDIVFTYSFALDPDVNTDNRTYVNMMVQLRVTSNMTCEILYKELYSPALFHLTYAKILPAHKFTDAEWMRQAKLKGRGPAFEGDPSYRVRKALPAQELEFTLSPVGTGPFKIFPLNGENLPMWRSGELVRLERHVGYWDRENVAAFTYLDFYIIDASLGQESAEVNFLSGGLDLFAIRPHQVEKYESLRDRYYIYKRPNLQYEYLAFNMEREPFNDKRIRRALAIAVDVDSIIQAVTYGQGGRVSGPGYPMLPYYDHNYYPDHKMLTGPNAGKTLEEIGAKVLPFSLEEAEAVLKEAGWAKNQSGHMMKDGKRLSFELIYSGTAVEPRGKISALARERWEQLGIEVKLKEMDFNVFINERVMTRNFDVMTLGWNGGIDYDKRKLWSSDQLPPAGYNFTSLKDEKSDQLFKEMLREYDADRIIDMSHEAFRMIADAQPYIFLFTSYSNLAVDRHLYWAKPVIGPDGKVKLDADGMPVREAMSFVADGQMDWKYGPRTQRQQHKRSANILFPANDNERAIVGEPTLVKDLKKPQSAPAEVK